MKTLLFGGAPSVGKSESIYRLTKKLISVGYIDKFEMVPGSFKDFTAILEKKSKNEPTILIAINTATDDIAKLNKLKKLLEDNPDVNILISSIRDDDFNPRSQFFDKSGIDETKDTIVEIPLAKITRKGDAKDPKSNKARALKWYMDKIDKLSFRTLANYPFNAM
jgi:hypothetical protein